MNRQSFKVYLCLFPTYLSQVQDISYQMWATAGQYTDPGVDYYQQKYQERLVNNLKKKAHSLGFELVAQSPVAKGVS
jgi:uncharacterized protein involved in cysteine biosynthesis